jgi:hypothetical protein
VTLLPPADAQHVRELVSARMLREALELVRNRLSEGSRYHDSATTLLGSLAAVDADEGDGTMSAQDARVEHRAIAKGILALVKRIEENQRLMEPRPQSRPDLRPPPPPPSSPVKILFIASNPATSGQLDLAEEARAISMSIQQAKYRDSFDLRTVWAARPDDLLRELESHRPQIVHFSGHGNEEGAIILTGQNNTDAPVAAAKLARVFSVLKDDIRLVVLNACFSETQAHGISQAIDCVVGMRVEIGDEAARVFAAAFYRALANGRSVRQALDQGCLALDLESIDESSTPRVVERKGRDASSVVFVTRQ